jgi:hypothetical protein
MASLANVAAARSFSTSASAIASLDASESRSVVAVGMVVWVAVARSSADYRADSMDARADASLATATTATSCISSWAGSARSSRVATLATVAAGADATASADWGRGASYHLWSAKARA